MIPSDPNAPSRIVPRVGVSRCLVGDRVRYDGGHKRDAFVVEDLAAMFELVPVCPEVEMGMSVPREPIHLFRREPGDDGIQLLGRESGTDYTARATRYAEKRVGELAAMRLSGFIVKSRSPSCGLGTTPILGGSTKRTDDVELGNGVFADELCRGLVDVPIIDETTLADPCARHAFIVEVVAHARLMSDGAIEALKRREPRDG